MMANVSVRCTILSEWWHDDVRQCVLRFSGRTASFTSVAPSLQWKQKCAADRYETPDRKHGHTELLTCQHADQLKDTESTRFPSTNRGAAAGNAAALQTLVWQIFPWGLGARRNAALFAFPNWPFLFLLFELLVAPNFNSTQTDVLVIFVLSLNRFCSAPYADCCEADWFCVCVRAHVCASTQLVLQLNAEEGSEEQSSSLLNRWLFQCFWFCSMQNVICDQDQDQDQDLCVFCVFCVSGLPEPDHGSIWWTLDGR